VIKYIVGGLLLGGLATVLMLERDPWVQHHIGEQFKQAFSSSLNCTIQGTIDQVTLTTPSLTLRDVVVRPCSGDAWQWKATRFTLSVSWLKMLLYGTLETRVKFDDYAATSQLHAGRAAIQDHIDTLMSGAALPVVTLLTGLQFTNAQFRAHDPLTNTTAYIRWRSNSRRINGVFQSRISLLDGHATVQGIQHIENMHGTFTTDSLYSPDAYQVNAHGVCACDLLRLPPAARRCVVRGEWHNDHGTFSVTSADHSLRVDPIEVTNSLSGYIIRSKAECALSHLASYVGFPDAASIKGAGTLHARAIVGGDVCDIQAHVVGKDIKYDDYHIASLCNLSFRRKQDTSSGSISCMIDDTTHLGGGWRYSWADGTGSLHLNNGATLTLPYAAAWSIDPQQLTLDCTRDATGTMTGLFHGVLRNKSQEKTVECTGALTTQGTSVNLTGSWGSLNYALQAVLYPTMRIQSLQCTDEHGAVMLSAQADTHDCNHLTTSLRVSLIRSLVASLWGYDVQGEGTVMIDAHCGALSTADVRMVNGSIRVPQMYNFVDGFKTHLVFDSAASTLTLSDSVCTLHRGSLQCSRAVFKRSPTGELIYAHVPCVIRNCLINFKQDLFANISGQVTACYAAGTMPRIAGSLIVERSQLKENIFSDQFQERLLRMAEHTVAPTGPDVACDLRIETASPVLVRTAFLEADAQIALNITNTIREPALSGSINVLSGKLLFPYKPLHITKGSLSFVPHQPLDPLIELVAKNQIRKHTVTMQVTGSLSQHHIMLDSGPPLSDEQIVALLLVGSEHESLNIVMPAVIMQNLTTLLFGDETSQTALDRYFKGLLKPFKSVHLVPRFSDQSGRGGLRGALEVEINDRWRALIQKNFSLTEDTRFEVEYQASDDVSLRAIRDEHRDVGAEVEMRWKF